MPKDKSVFKRGDVWYIRYDAPPHPDGSRNQKMLSCKGMDEKQARHRLRCILDDIASGRYIDKTPRTVEEFIRKWLDECARIRLTKSTFELYNLYADKYIIPRLGRFRLQALRAVDVQEFYNRLLDSGQRKSKGGLSPKSIRNIHGVLHAALKQAVRWRLVPYNVTDDVDLPRKVRTERTAATEEELITLMGLIAKSPYRLPIVLALVTGIRRGEIAALKWMDFDKDRNTLRISRSITHINGGVEEKETKTGSISVVVLPPSIAKELEEYRNGAMSNEYIFSRSDGRPLRPRTLTDNFRKIVRDAEIPSMTFHGLRHTLITHLLSAGIPLQVVSERVSHASGDMTMHYAHVLPHMQDQATQIIEELWQRINAKAV